MFYKEKGFYISLLCGLVAVAAFGTICYNLMKNDGDGDGAQPQVAAETLMPEPAVTPAGTPAAQEVLANEAESKTEKEKKEKEKKKKKVKAKETVATDAQPVKDTLHFDEEVGLLWPVKGDILMKYSADQVVYFKTLAQYRTNPAVLIEAKEGDPVKASADGIVADVSTSEETGRTITMDIGDDFAVKYGQLKEVAVGTGDSVTEGQVIGKVAAPTKYYSVEGTNLYLQVLQKNTPVNPLVLLR